LLKPVIILDPAADEINDAAAFYNERVVGLGSQLLIEPERTLVRVTQQPKAGQLMNRDTRRQLLRRFPYAVLYREEEQHIVVVAIMHQHRRSNYWEHR